MIARRTVTAGASAVLVGLGVAGFATPAYAAETVTCPGGASPQSLTLSGSGPFEFFNASPYCQGFNVTTTLPVVDSPPVSSGISLKKSLDEATFTQDITGSAWVNQTAPWENTQAGIQITATGVSGTVVVEFYATSSATTPVYTYTITVGSGGGGGGDTPSGDTGFTALNSGPGPHVQQFGMPESGTCDEAASDDLNWSGVESGGWGESWAQWPNDGQGGAVCSRTLEYNASQGAWEVD